MFNAEYVENLRCPFCKSAICLQNEVFLCRNCKSIFKIRGGIPIFTEQGDKNDLAEMEKLVKKLESMADSEFTNTIERFRLPAGKYTLANRYLENKSFKKFFSLFPNLSNLRILDLSCGVGHEAQILLEGGANNLYLLDVSFPAVSYTKGCFEKFYPKHNLYYLVSNDSHLPFPEHFFDIVLVHASAHHYHDFNLFLNEARRVSKNICLISEPTEMEPFQWLIKLIGWNTEYGKLKTPRFKKSELIKQFSNLGIKCETERLFQYYPRFLEKLGNLRGFVNIWFLLLKFLDKCLPKAAHSINIYATASPKTEK